MSVHAVALSAKHNFSKPTAKSIKLLAGLGVEGDCHLGITVQHRSRLHIKPAPQNLRQVHLISYEILSELGVKPGEIGENITTLDVDLLSLGTGTRLHFLRTSDDEAWYEEHPVVVVQGLRNPCPQIDKFRKGLKEKFIVRDEERNIIAKTAGVMGTVEAGGRIKPGMVIGVEYAEEYYPLECV